ncbi:hypothetical protein D4Q71_05360 [Rhodopseudomonas palustris]|nr:hypothetical protein B1S06_04480 [Rhodopseudomonas palustris]RJF66712.1 hypothetical protein D4Q71_05360 [Rhodopseudomonas palustris]
MFAREKAIDLGASAPLECQHRPHADIDRMASFREEFVLLKRSGSFAPIRQGLADRADRVKAIRGMAAEHVISFGERALDLIATILRDENLLAPCGVADRDQQPIAAA